MTSMLHIRDTDHLFALMVTADAMSNTAKDRGEEAESEAYMRAYFWLEKPRQLPCTEIVPILLRDEIERIEVEADETMHGAK